MARGNLIVHNLKQLDSSATSTSLDVPVTHAMAPSAQIVAYVITGDGEVVADSLSVSVAIGFENSVCHLQRDIQMLNCSKVEFVYSGERFIWCN